MLTADHVRGRRKNGELVVRPLNDGERTRALTVAEAYLGIAQSSVGRRREELVQAWSAVPVAVRDKRIADGLRKLVEDECEFDVVAPSDPVALRSTIFLRASAARRELEGLERFDRAAILEPVALEQKLPPADLDRALYADLKGEQILCSVKAATATFIVRDYERGQAQAVLLRAEKVVADVLCATPAAYRGLFHELKFRRLLYRIEPRETGYRIEIDGPYSLFESVTKYGLGLALVLPALEACDSLTLVAQIRWGKTREPLLFRHEHRNDADRRRPTPRLRDDVESLRDAFAALDTPWRVRVSTQIFDLPGVGVCVPDLVFQHDAGGEPVHFEALGFWSRDAVFRRVDLVQRGLARPMLFAVSSRLRVSEAVLDSDEPASLYVYKGTMNARTIERKLDDVRSRHREKP
ncbi:MAG TPA: DUF790 family protein [Polyangiaceae bacterium]|jgi:hypothetical protein|nr:DUF790 family protein [Polyangiaceae bacterium]